MFRKSGCTADLLKILLHFSFFPLLGGQLNIQHCCCPSLLLSSYSLSLASLPVAHRFSKPPALGCHALAGTAVRILSPACNAQGPFPRHQAQACAPACQVL